MSKASSDNLDIYTNCAECGATFRVRTLPKKPSICAQCFSEKVASVRPIVDAMQNSIDEANREPNEVE